MIYLICVCTDKLLIFCNGDSYMTSAIAVIKEKLYKLIHAPISAIKRRKKISYAQKQTRKETKPKLILALTPEYGNMGDQIITVAEKMWFKTFFPEYSVVEFTQDELINDQHLSAFKASIKESDVIFFQGGGNLNDMYLQAENIRRKILLGLPNNRIVLFQQSISFGSSEQSIAIKEKTSEIYNKHQKLTICTREKKSFDFAKEMFPNKDTLLYPDMAVFLINKIKNQNRRNGHIALCFRDDREKLYSEETLKKAVAPLKNKYICDKIDTHVHHVVSRDNRYNEVIKLIELFSSFDIVITDRFHGIIYSFIANTPCVALKSADHKIESGIKWFEGCNMVRYANSAEKIVEEVNALKSCLNYEFPDFNNTFSAMADKIREITNL